LESLASQQQVDATVLYLEQSDSRTVERRLPSLARPHVRFQFERIPAVSHSYARNYAIKNAATDVLLYIDSDAIADPLWSAKLSEALLQEEAAVSGGKILPKWHGKPLAIARSRLVLEQYSLLDLGEGTTEVSKVVGAGFGINRKLLGSEAHFASNLGRRKGSLLSGEETDLCSRAIALGQRIAYVGAACIHHQILPERIRYRWILRRFFYAGLGRARRGGRPDPSHGNLTPFDFIVLPLVLPFYLSGYLWNSLRSF
jgi:glycosyltransferase involved in cell wall biosynthesis